MHFEEAIKTYNAVLEIKPTHIPSVQALAYILLERGQRDKADALTKRALDGVSPRTNVDYLALSELKTFRADVLMWNAKFDEAEQSLREASEAAERAALWTALPA